MKACKEPGCPLTPTGNGACWQHQPDHVKAEERERRRVSYAKWYADTMPWRQAYWDRLKKEAS